MVRNTGKLSVPATNLTEEGHNEREALGVDVGGEGVLPEVESVLLVDGHAVV